MKTSREIVEIGIEESREEEETMKYSSFFKKKWYSEDEIKKAIDKCYSYGHAEPLTDYYNEKDDNLICVAQLLELLFNAPDLNSRSFNKDSLNKGYEVNQK
jgi:hypothetical protein